MGRLKCGRWRDDGLVSVQVEGYYTQGTRVAQREEFRHTYSRKYKYVFQLTLLYAAPLCAHYN